MEKFDLDEGHWVTVGGRRIFIKDGESLPSAMKRSGKFKSAGKKQSEVAKGEKERWSKQLEHDKSIANDESQSKEMREFAARRAEESRKEMDRYQKYEERFSQKEKESDLASDRSKQYSDIEKASGLKVERSFQTDAYGNGNEDHFELSDGRTVVHSRESLGKKEDSWSIETVEKGSINSQNFKSYDEMIDHLKGGSGKSNNGAYKKAFEEYKKKHPNSKLTLNRFIDMSEGK